MKAAPTMAWVLLAACAHAPSSAPSAGPSAELPPEPPPTSVETAEVADQAPPPPKVLEIAPPKIALVLGGGGARGFAHVGVLRVLEQEKIPIDLIVGTSVGSLIGALYASNPSSFELEWKAFKIERDDLFDFSFLSAASGPVKGQAIRQFVRRTIPQRDIEDLRMPFVALATDLKTGERVEFDRGDVALAVRASVSIPGVFRPVVVRGRTLVDGGVVANLGVETARARGADIIIASNVTKNVVGHEVDDVVSITLQSINLMMGEMAALHLRDADVVVTPDVGAVGTMDFDHRKECMQAGIEATMGQIPLIKEAITRHYVDRGGAPPSHLLEPPI